MKAKRLKIIHIITSLGVGGAEKSLLKLLKDLPREEFESEVMCLTKFEKVGLELQAIGIPVRTLDLSRGSVSVAAFFRLSKWLRKANPDVVQTWMYHADLMGGIAAVFARVPRIVWNIRHGNLDRTANKKMTVLVARVCAMLSRLVPDRIVCNSRNAQTLHIEIGYDAKRFVTIPNGFDIEKFYLDPQARIAMRREWGIDDSLPLVGLVSRFDDLKDIPTFLKAAGIASQNSPMRFVLCGRGQARENEILRSMLKSTACAERVLLLGERDDVKDVINGLDVLTLTSKGEGFPNILGEAMACEVPCVATNAGDAAFLMGETGKIVPVGDAQALAEAWQQSISTKAEERRALGMEARKRILNEFSQRATTQRYRALYWELARKV